MGLVVSIVQESLEVSPTVVLDDGTGLAAVVTPASMLEAIRCGVGASLDCLVRVERTYCSSKSDAFQLHAEALIVVPDAHTETLRWLELAYRKQQGTTVLASKTGYPCDRVQVDNVYQLIQTESKHQYRGQQGMSAQDLAVVLDIQADEAQEMIQDLQIQGLVYQNQAGAFLPL
jgi:hypothetical protein